VKKSGKLEKNTRLYSYWNCTCKNGVWIWS